MGMGFCAFWMATVYTTLYAVVSRLPMIFAMVHMLTNLKLQGWIPAIIFCGYCLARLTAAWGTSRFFGMPVMFFGTLTGVIGYTAIFFYPDHALVFGLMVVLTGFTETVTGIDTILKIEALIEDMSKEWEQQLFRSHLVGATAGSFIAYFAGGYIFEFFDVKGTCIFGIGVSVTNTLVLLVYCCCRPAFCRSMFISVDTLLKVVESSEVEAITDLNANLDTVSRVGGGRKRPSVQGGRQEQFVNAARSSLFSETSSVNDALKTSDGRGSAGFGEVIQGQPVTTQEEEQPAKKVMKRAATLRDGPTYAQMEDSEKRRVRVALMTIVLSFYVTVLPISNNFGVLALYWHVAWGKGTTVSGMLMALGEFGGLCVLWSLNTDFMFNLSLLKPFKRPVNLCCATLASSIAVALVASPVMALSALGSVGVHVVNVLLHSFCSECAANWSPRDVFATWIGRCYLSKRFSNATVAALTINLFFMQPHFPARPFVFVASVVSVWSFFLAAVFWWLRLMPWQDASAKPAAVSVQKKLEVDTEVVEEKARTSARDLFSPPASKEPSAMPFGRHVDPKAGEDDSNDLLAFGSGVGSLRV